jgi:hypothetical protein
VFLTQVAKRVCAQGIEMTESPHIRPEEHSGTATAEEGVVMLDGPDGVAVTMTAEAAAGTGHALIDAAEKASGQSAEPKPR